MKLHINISKSTNYLVHPINISLKTCFIGTCFEFRASKHQHHDCTQHIKLMDNQIKVSTVAGVTSKANEIEQGTAGERLKCY